MGGIIDFVFQIPIKYHIVKQSEFDCLKKECEIKLANVPEDNKSSKNLGITLKTFEDSKYQLNDSLLRDYFSSLISRSVDNRYSVPPLFSSLIKEMSNEDAKLFKLFNDRKFVFDTKIDVENTMFKTDIYRLHFKKKYYAPIENIEHYFLYREPREKISEIHYHDAIELNIEPSIIFLLSKGLIEIAPGEEQNMLIPGI